VELKVNAATSGSGATYTDKIVSKTNPGGTCSNPPPATSFVTTDNTVYLYFLGTTTLSDQLSSDWLAPDGTVVSGAKWNPNNPATYCFVGASLSIVTLPASQLGAWQARIYDNGILQFSIPFTVASPNGGGQPPPPLAPQIDNITPTTAPIATNTVFTLTGSGFELGFKGELWVNNSSFPLNPGAQTHFIDANHVQLTVSVGAPGSPTTPFSLQVVNQDGQASNIYGGLTAVAGGGGGQIAAIRVSFQPNPTYPAQIAACPSSGGIGYNFEFIINEENGVGITPTGLNIDGGTSFTPPNFTQHITPNGTAQFGLYWCRSAGSSTWTVTAKDDNGNTVSGSAVLVMH
jgi:hypothetical protein